jgi:hydrogenase maturation protein HypF
MVVTLLKGKGSGFNKSLEVGIGMERWRVTVSGLVQGVGFRPFLFNLAGEKGISGWVRNNFAGVELEIQGAAETLEGFLADLKRNSPSAALIDEITTAVIPVVPEAGFVILESQKGRVLGSPLPDQGICDACRAEFLDRDNRRYQHPFNSCVVCGPRFTIIRSLPFDRPRTTMDEFELCPSCLEEYSSPVDRRFHAQTIACPECGPRLWFADSSGRRQGGAAIETAVEILKSGGIIAVKGIGGYHLACNAGCEEPVERLRKLKDRDQRPFAVMFKDLDALQAHCEITPGEERLLSSAVRPIVLLTQKSGSPLAGSINPGLKEVGAFLPYTGIQLLLFGNGISALVMTSGNRSGEPLSIDDEAAFRDLGPMVAGFLGHNRRILWRCDDSVVRVLKGKTLGIRRSRGYSPAPVKVKKELAPLLACGAQQKNTFALTRGDQVYLSPHQGDLDNLASFLAYRETIERFQALLDCHPEWVVHDLHPDYNSTGYALGTGLKPVGVQHHLAHVASVIASQQITGPVIGVALDGSGYGTDGKIWGGEFLAGEGCSWQRAGFLSYYPLPGGEAAIREPWRMAASYLERSNPGQLETWLFKNGLSQKWAQLRAAVQLGINAPETSSAGRLFDGVASLVGGILEVSYEGEAAIRLEKMADLSAEGSYGFKIGKEGAAFTVDPGTVADQVCRDLNRSSAGTISMKFHRTMAALIGEMAGLIGAETNYRQVVLSGGVFQNRLLLDLTWEILGKKGFRVFLPEIIPVNDAGISLGQAWLGSLMIERGVWDVFGDSR